MHWAFSAILIAYVLAHVAFVQTILVVIGGRKVYAIDVVFAFIVAALLAALWSTGPRDFRSGPRSLAILALFTAWGLFELALGFPRFGLSAFGESRIVVLPSLFCLFVVAWYRNAIDLKKLLTFAVAVICLMPVVRGAIFYLGGGRAALVDYFTNPSLGAQAGFRFLQAGEAALVSCAAVGLLMFTTVATAGRRRHALWLLSSFLLVVLAVVQVRSAWVMVAVGLALGSVLVARFFKYAIVSVAAAASVLVLIEPVGAWWRSRSSAQFESIQPSEHQPASAEALGARPSKSGPPQGASLQSSLEYSTTFLRDVNADVTAMWRLTLWRQALASAKEHPLIGHGLGGYWQNVDPNGTPANQTPHNGYLAVLVKLGGIGLALFLAGLIFWGAELIRFLRHEHAPGDRLLAKAVLVTAIMMATFAGLYDFTIAFWILIGAGCVLIRSGTPAAAISARGR